MWTRPRFTLRLRRWWWRRQCLNSDSMTGPTTGPFRIARITTTIIGTMTGMTTGMVAAIGIIIGGKTHVMV